MAFGRKKDESAHSAAQSRQDVSGIMTRAIVRYVRKTTDDATVARLLQVAGEQRSVDELEESTTWSSYAEYCALLEAAASVTGDREIGRRIGEYVITDYDATEVTDLLRALGRPGECYRNMAPASAKFTTVTPLDALEVGDAHAVLQCEARGIHRRNVLDCDVTKGMLSAVPVLFELVPATITESECQARGGRHCLYSVAWEEGQWSEFVEQGTSMFAMAWDQQGVVEAQAELDIDDKTRIEQLQRQLEATQQRLEGVYTIAAEMLSDDDLNQVLSRIAGQAAYAVNAPRYLLVVNPSGEADDIRLQQKGFDFEEASALAAELLQGGEAAKSGGSRLVAAVHSPRHAYGYIAAVYPPGNEFFEQEQRILDTYANFAAAALDVVTALDESRRSEKTSRALLTFAGQLAKVGSSQQVAEQLAEAVPIVVGCDRASVFLWDEEESALVLRATYTAAEAIVAPEPPTVGRLTAPEDLPEMIVGPGDSPYVKQLLESPNILIVDRYDTDATAVSMLAQAEAATSVLAPLMGPEGCLGVVVALYQRDVAEHLRTDKNMRALMEGLANQAVVALMNAKMVDQISHMALHDALTGLPNRRLLQDRVDQAIARSDRTGELLSLFFVDLDRFKHVNDTLGHAAGDDLIIQVAKRLKEATRKGDTVARLGGDEFCVLCPGMTEPPAIAELAERMLATLSKPFLLLDTHIVDISGSIGVAIAPKHGHNYDELVGCADAAMYVSKEKGRNQYHVFDPSSMTSSHG